jgi:parvulin-like peptidyl-prolyl isomerase
MLKIKSLIFFSLVILYVFSLPKDCLSVEDEIIAIVNKDIITQKDLNDFLNFMRMQLSSELQGRQLEERIQAMKVDLLQRLIEDKLILQEGKKADFIKIDENKLKVRVNEIKKRYPSESEFKEELKRQGLTQSDIENKLREQALMYAIINYKVKSKISVSPSEVTHFYEQNKEQFITPEVRDISVVQTQDKEIAYLFAKKVKGGTDFKTASKEYSLTVDSLSVANNGQLAKNIEEIVFSLGLSGISEPIKMGDNYFVLEVNRISPSSQQSLAEVKDKIAAFLFEKKLQENLARWLDELKKHSYIKIS